MTINCGNCTEGHDTVADVRRCHGVAEQPVWPASEKQIAYVIGLQEQRDLPDEYDVRTEAQLKAMDRAEVSRCIEELKGLPYKAPSGKAAAPGNDAGSIPAGHYALNVDADAGRGPVWMFFEVTHGKGRWDGYTFVKRLIGSPGDYRKEPMDARSRYTVLASITKDPQKAASDYGLQSRRCGLCRSPLTDPKSLARGIGPDCAKKHGW